MPMSGTHWNRTGSGFPSRGTGRRILIHIFLAHLFLWLALSGTVQSAEEVRRVIVSGSALRQARDDRSRSEAMDDAFQNAVGQVVQDMVPTDVLKENYSKVESEILSQSSSYVGNYTILEEFYDQQTGQVDIKMEVEVQTIDLTNDLKAIGVLLSKKRYPRLMVLFEETNLGSDTNDHPAETASLNEFLARGFTAVDQAVVAQLRHSESARAALRGDDRAAKELALSQGAEVMILGNASSEKVDLEALNGTGLVSCQAQIQARAVVANTAEIIAVESEISSAAQVSPLGAGAKCLAEGSAALTERLIGKVLKHWNEDVSASTRIKLLISGLPDYGSLLKIKKAFEADPDRHQNVEIRDFAGTSAELDLLVKGDAYTLAEYLTDGLLPGPKLEVVGAAADRLELRWSGP